MWYPFHAVQLDVALPSDDQAQSSAGRSSILTVHQARYFASLLCFDMQARAFRNMLQREGSHLPVGKDILDKRIGTGACLCKANV